MKEEINLLSPSAKQSRRAWIARNHLLYLVRRIVFVWLLFVAVLTGSYVYIWQRQRTLTRELVLHQGKDGQASQEVQRINETMSVVRTWVETHPAWTPLLPDVVRLAPAAVRIEILAVQPGEEALTVRGTSSSRTAVVEMQQELEKLPWVEKVEAPLQNFAAGDKSEFSFMLTRASNEKSAN